jgi:RNA polymerase sigma-70 factor (ECF subfamily)
LLEERLKESATVQSAAEVVGRSVDAAYKALARIRRLLHDCIERALAVEGR